jgi:uncharacterized membrane protein
MIMRGISNPTSCGGAGSTNWAIRCIIVAVVKGRKMSGTEGARGGTMVAYMKDVFSIRSTWVLLSLSIFSVLLTVVRGAVTGRWEFLFLWWNLFLAFVPWTIATLTRVREIRSRWLLGILLVLWVAFFPNAPYILTDFVHLQPNWGAPLWFDLILILSFAFAGMLYGFVSLHILEERFLSRFSTFWGSAISVGLIYLSCFGIYLGRFLRWNSWDLVDNFGPIMSDVFARVADPLTHTETWGFTILFGTFLNLMYWSYKAFGKER